jgi:hypothetical protein
MIGTERYVVVHMRKRLVQQRAGKLVKVCWTLGRHAYLKKIDNTLKNFFSKGQAGLKIAEPMYFQPINYLKT